MQSRLRCASSLALAFAGLATLAATAQPVPVPPRLSAGPAAPASRTGAPVMASTHARAASAAAANTRVIEDEDVRIEETRGPRGQLQRITVHHKTSGAKAYEIILPPGGKDASQARGAAGQRAWSLFDF